MSLNERLTGVLLHPTSLPGKFGIGDLGPAAYTFANWLKQAGMAYWQILPLGPTGFGDSPYQCFSAFAGNPLLISPELLLHEKLLTVDEINTDEENYGNVSYGEVFSYKHALLTKAFHNFNHNSDISVRNDFESWKDASHIKSWLADYALFMALKKFYHGKPWNEWDNGLKERHEDGLAWARNKLKSAIEYEEFIQYIFFKQWDSLRQHVNSLGIKIIGDAPIYVSYDSADTWANQSEFLLREDKKPAVVAGVPPDYFSVTGQLWGNPLYNWQVMAANGYQWWINRLKSIFRTVDWVRLDHFRGFMGYYAVPSDHKTAEYGTWQIGPGKNFFDILAQTFNPLPIIAEDLGEITEDVTTVRKAFNFPGMIILQFAWTPVAGNPLVSDPNNHFLPHLHEKNSIVYTGTHDNDTTLGWWRHTSTEEERRLMQVYLSVDGNQANWDLIRAGMASVANTFIVPAQDLLDLDTDARMNTPGRAEGNWSWRLQPDSLTDELAHRLYEMTLTYGRCATPPPEATIQPPKQPFY